MVCDICGVEYFKGEKRHWYNVIAAVHIDFKKHAGIQREIKKDMCTSCANKLDNIIIGWLEENTKKRVKNDKL